jgi:hypothetical protein
MPQTPHIEKHFTSSESVRDIVIGMSDGLTVPFALAAGLSGAVDATPLDWPRLQPGRLQWAWEDICFTVIGHPYRTERGSFAWKPAM